MNIRLADRVNRIKPSSTLAVSAKAKELQGKGIEVLNFSAGEPDFDTPLNIKRAGIKAIAEGFTKYTPVGGVDELKDAIIEKLSKENNLEYKRSQLIISCGAKQSVYNLTQVLLDENDEVIIPAPYWVSYPDIVLLAGAKPIILNTFEDDGFKITPEKLERAITKRSKLLILNSPNNPTGCFYTKEELSALGEIILKYKLLVLSDDIYEKILYDDLSFCNIANIGEEFKELTFIVNGVSKSYSMTGWRIGYLAGNDEVIAAVSKIQGHSTSNPSSISQKAAIEAYIAPQNALYDMVKEFKRRRDYIVDKLNSIPGISCFKPAGSFYVFPRVSSLYKRKFKNKEILNSVELCNFFLEIARVAAVPGGAFGNDECIRMSYTTSMENIEKGMDQINSVISMLE
ncbi:MAG: pyridoxal phosphate-dependent aminotransferase [Thermodesulfobacteriota bacterium]|nr:pyridoxal phosphate-dependent aminotransferase [Thermodesulfobacteriota bacterium]